MNKRVLLLPAALLSFSVRAVVNPSSPLPSYAIQRLKHHVEFLQKINTAFKKPLIIVDTVPSLCQHELMRWCIKKIHDEQCIDVVFDVWKAFVAHAADVCEEDCLFTHDFAALIYVIYVNIIAVAVRASFQEFMLVYGQVAELPLEELLAVLDMFYEKLGIILQAYSSATSYTDWVQNYWWLPVAVLAATVTQVINWYIRHTLYKNA